MLGPPPLPPVLRELLTLPAGGKPGGARLAAAQEAEWQRTTLRNGPRRGEYLSAYALPMSVSLESLDAESSMSTGAPGSSPLSRCKARDLQGTMRTRAKQSNTKRNYGLGHTLLLTAPLRLSLRSMEGTKKNEE